MRRRSKSRRLVLLLAVFIIVTTGGLVTRMYFVRGGFSELQSSIVTAADLISALAAIFGVVAIWYQLKKDNDISRADFLLNLNRYFTEQASTNNLYQKLKTMRDAGGADLTSEDRIALGDYIIFFEVLETMLDNEVIDLETVDQLFSGRFFIMANNEYLQGYLLDYPQFTRPMFRLYRRWADYRQSVDLGIPYADHALDADPEKFDEILREHGGLR